MSHILLKYPTRNRADLFRQTFSKYRDKLSGKHEYTFLISMDQDDPSMNNQHMVEFIDSQRNVIYSFGNSKSKIQAINADMGCVPNFDVLLLISDDMVPEVHGYDDIICSKMQEHFPDTFGALHFNDGRTGQGLNTLSIMGKAMYDHFGYIYHPQYSSFWCDNEFTDVTVGMNKVAYIDQVIIKHAWIDVTGKDALYAKNEKFYQSDQLIYNLRKYKGFPKENVIGDAQWQKEWTRLTTMASRKGRSRHRVR